jgi:transcriptional regulator with XRE-family HTH domain
MSDMEYMKGLTIKEMSEKLGISPNTVKQRLFQRAIKPICKDALYDVSALKQISDFGPKGFQPKDKSEKAKKEKK